MPGIGHAIVESTTLEQGNTDGHIPHCTGAKTLAGIYTD
jgi:hypothetical protein